jgi:UDPglucose 6-dehydrogenase
VKALHKSGKDINYNFKILEAVVDVNEKQKTILFPELSSFFDNDLKGKTIAIWGLAFKPETDDIREAPALYMIDKLLEAGAKVKAFDPEAMDNVKEKYGDKISFGKDMYEVTEGADALLICTEWSIFRTPDYNRLKSNLENPVIFDGRNLYPTVELAKEGIHYISIGRQKV